MTRMKLLSLIAVSGFMVTTFWGCEIVTEQQNPPPLQTANSVVINELFILPPPDQNAYQWIELYNPTNHDIDVTKWTLGFRTSRGTFAMNTSTGQVTNIFYQDSTLTYHDVLLYGIYQVDTTYVIENRTPPDTVRTHSDLIVRPRSMASHAFLTYVTNEDRMLTYTDWGPGGGDKFIGTVLQEYRHDFWIVTLDSTQDTVRSSVKSDSSVFTYTAFGFQTAEQIFLKDSSGNVVDLLRYGGANFQYPSPDPYSDNRALGAIVPFQSFARYAVAYKTGAYSNSASDFYVTGVQVPLTRPIPQWVSQAYKQ